jgi:hypothetical protein
MSLPDIMTCRREKDMNDGTNDHFDLDELLHPADAFGHPSEVVKDPDLTINEKRAILSAWASDVCATKLAPQLRGRPQRAPVRFDDIIDALRTLDRQANGQRYRPLALRRRIFGRHRRDSDSNTGSPSH